MPGTWVCHPWELDPGVLGGWAGLRAGINGKVHTWSTAHGEDLFWWPRPAILLICKMPQTCSEEWPQTHERKIYPVLGFRGHLRNQTNSNAQRVWKFS